MSELERVERERAAAAAEQLDSIKQKNQKENRSAIGTQNSHSTRIGNAAASNISRHLTDIAHTPAVAAATAPDIHRRSAAVQQQPYQVHQQQHMHTPQRQYSHPQLQYQRTAQPNQPKGRSVFK